MNPTWLPSGWIVDYSGFVYTADGFCQGHLSHYDHKGRWLGEFGPGRDDVVASATCPWEGEGKGAAGEDLGPCDPIDDLPVEHEYPVEHERDEEFAERLRLQVLAAVGEEDAGWHDADRIRAWELEQDARY